MRKKARKYQKGGILGANLNSLVSPISNTRVAPVPTRSLMPTIDSIFTTMPGFNPLMPVQSNLSTYLISSDHAGFEGSNKSKSKDRYREKQMGGDLVSTLGYRDDSPFKNASSLNINSSNISMENVSTPLYGTSNQTGETILMKPNKNYKFKNTSSVTEMPAYQSGGELDQYLKQGKAYNKKAAAYLRGLRAAKHKEDIVAPLEHFLYSPYTMGEPGDLGNTDFGVRFAGNVQAQIPDSADAFKAPEPMRKPQVKAPAKIAQRSLNIDRTAPNIQSQYNVIEQGAQTPITKKAYNNLMKGELLQEYKTGRKLNNSAIVPKYNQGGALDSILGAIQGIGPALGPIGMAASGVATLAPLVMDLFAKPDNTVVSGSPGKYNKGGDMQLSNGAFQVKGKPGQVDGNKYNYGGTPVALDHNEVVSDDFVYSEDLPNPIADESFAELAAIQEKAKGKLQKKSRVYPYDPITQNTMKYTQSNLDALSTIQENVATLLGHRNADGSTRQKYKTGGTLKYQSGMDALANPELGQSQYQREMLLQYMLGATPRAQYLPDPGLNPIANILPYPSAPGLTPEPNPGDMGVLRNTLAGIGTPYTPPPPTGPVAPKTPRTGAARKAAPTTAAGDPLLASIQNYASAEGPYGDPTREVMRNMLPFTTIPSTRNPMADQLFSQNSSFSAVQGVNAPNLPAGSAIPEEQLSATADAAGYRTPFTVGDALQGVNVLSKFVQGFQKPEVEPTETIGTPITQETYDPTNQLYRNQRQYQNALNRNYGSANVRRGVANQLLATKLSADQDVSSQYNQMNQRARTDYQNRIAQRRGQNIQLDQYTRDLNARNRGARRNALDNAFNSLSNFGIGLNAKSQANDTVNMLSQLYPDVSQRAIDSLTKEDLLKILLRNGDK